LCALVGIGRRWKILSGSLHAAGHGRDERGDEHLTQKQPDSIPTGHERSPDKSGRLGYGHHTPNRGRAANPHRPIVVR
jgi:hypothetical protein